MSIPAVTAGLPRTDDVPLPSDWMMSTFRRPAQQLLRAHYRIEVLGGHRVPAGPVVIAANHVGFVDGPLMAGWSPRPVHVLTKAEMFTGAMGRFLLAAGQIPVERDVCDVPAVRIGLAVLRAGRMLGLFPEANRGGGEVVEARPGAAYFATVTGAPVVPLAFLGTRIPGGGRESVPPRGSRMVLSFGEPMHFGQHEWPRTRAELDEGGERVRRALAAHVAAAQESTGLRLPGPLPEDER